MIHEQADLIKTRNVLSKKVVEIEKEKEKGSEYPRSEKPQESEVNTNKITVGQKVETENLS